jgi:arsenate reductase-like glutaredoxin family protein
MDKEAFKFPDEADNKAPPAEEFELELEGSEQPEVEVVDDTPPEDRGRKPLEKEVLEPTEDELNEYSSKVQKRLKELTHARHDERRKAEALAREKAELERAARALAEENRKLQEYVQVGQKAFINTSKSLAEKNMASAEAALKSALDSGDTEAAVAAQKDLFRAQMEMGRVDDFKPINLPEQKEQVYTQPITQQPASPQLDDRVVDWAEKNPWFERPGNEDMTGYAYGVHNKLVRQYGEAYTKTDEYYSKIDTAMRKAFPERFDDVEPEKEEAPRRNRNVVAPVQRTSAPKKIRLTQTQQNVAKRLGIPLELYAKKLAELENQNG